jgi:hypothetical protein
MAATIKFRIDKNGDVHIDVDGVHDMSCAELTKKFEERLGTKVDVQIKPECDVILDGTQLYCNEGEEE